MAFYYGAQQHQHSGNHSHSHNHHGGRSRRGPRLNSQNSHRQFRGVRSMKELAEAPMVSAYRMRFEACKGFDLDDDLEFCPNLLTDDDFSPFNSSVSDRSSMSSGSPSGSPVQHQANPAVQVSPPFMTAQTFVPAAATTYVQQQQQQFTTAQQLKTHKAIPIVNPSTGMRVPSPPTSTSPSRMQQQTFANARRWVL